MKILLNNAATLDPAKNVKACEDFLLTVLHAYVVAAAKQLLSTGEKYEKVDELACAIVNTYLSFDPDAKRSAKDKKLLYSNEVLNLGLLWHAFNDSIKEGDGDRVLMYWKLLLVVFKAKRHTNYCKEAIVLLSQYHCQLSKRKAAQLKWCRFVNTKGRKGCNISCDLHLEHLNRRLKGMIAGLHSNGTKQQLIDRAARSIGVVDNVCNIFESENEVNPDSDKHNKPSFEKDFNFVLELLEEEEVFQEQAGRCHASFKKIKYIFQHCPSKQLSSWIKERLKKYKYV